MGRAYVGNSQINTLQGFHLSNKHNQIDEHEYQDIQSQMSMELIRLVSDNLHKQSVYNRAERTPPVKNKRWRGHKDIGHSESFRHIIPAKNLCHLRSFDRSALTIRPKQLLELLSGMITKKVSRYG